MCFVFNKAKKEPQAKPLLFPLPNDNDVDNAKELLEVLRPLKIGTDFFQTGGPLSSKVIGTLLTIFQQEYDLKVGTFMDLQMTILKNLDERFHQTLADPTYIIASLLDPCQKTLLFESKYT